MMGPVTELTHWITGTDPSRAAPLLRAEFEVPDGVRARLRVAALGYADVTINGQPASPDRLVPGQTQYDRAVGVVEWDVSQFLGQTGWAVGVGLGRGFFDMEVPSAWDWHKAPWRARPALWLELEVDGQVVGRSDGSWRTSTGGTTIDSLYEGESFDERLEPDGWRLPRFDASGWEPVHITTYDGQLRRLRHAPVRVIDTHELAWRQVGQSRWIGDVGRVIAGWARVEPSAPVNLAIVHSERLAPSGQKPLTGNIHVSSPRFQTDQVHTSTPWEARFTYKGFRYLEVTGIEDPSLVRAVEAHADVARVGQFTSSHPTLAWWHDAFTATVLANLHHVPTDTPTYEKNGWTGDAQIAARAILHTLDAGSLLEKFLDDLTDGQRADGQLPVIAPTADWGYDGECAPAPEWTIALPVIALELAEETGDASLLARHTPAIRAWLERELSLLDADGLAVGVLGDYLSPGTPGPPPEDIRFYSTASLAHALWRLAATQLDLDPGLRELAATAGPRLADSLNRAFLEWEPAPGPDTVGEARYADQPRIPAGTIGAGVGMGSGSRILAGRVAAAAVGRPGGPGLAPQPRLHRRF